MKHHLRIWTALDAPSILWAARTSSKSTLKFAAPCQGAMDSAAQIRPGWVLQEVLSRPKGGKGLHAAWRGWQGDCPQGRPQVYQSTDWPFSARSCGMDGCSLHARQPQHCRLSQPWEGASGNKPMPRQEPTDALANIFKVTRSAHCVLCPLPVGCVALCQTHCDATSWTGSAKA